MPITLNTVAHRYHIGFDTASAVVAKAGIAPIMKVQQGKRTVSLYDDSVEQTIAAYVAEKAAKRAAKKSGAKPARIDAGMAARIDELMLSLDRIELKLTRIDEKLDVLEQSLSSFSPVDLTAV